MLLSDLVWQRVPRSHLTAFPFGLEFWKTIFHIFSTFFRLLFRLFSVFSKTAKIKLLISCASKVKTLKIFRTSMNYLISSTPNSPTNPNPTCMYRIHVPVRNRVAVISRSWEVNLSRVCSVRYVPRHIAGIHRRYY